MLSYDTTAGSWEEYLWMFENTCLDFAIKIVTVVVKVFGLEHMREPTIEDTEMLMALSITRGWSSMLGCLDCMH